MCANAGEDHYLIFFVGWLNTPVAVISIVVLGYAFCCAFRGISLPQQEPISWRDVRGFLLVILLVNLSGAGGYGWETPDYAVHNARLGDLVLQEWPVRYGENQNLVGYVGFFLPAAVLGKLTSVDTALYSLYFWTVFGMTLVLRWMSYLSGWRFSWSAVLMFSYFGPLDIVNIWLINLSNRVPLNSTIQLGAEQTVDFASTNQLGFFMGNYLSNTFQLYWAPHQVIAGWLGISIITYLYKERRTGSLVFAYSLLCIWSPFVMIGMVPFIALAVLPQLRKNWRDVLTHENTVGSGLLVLIFVTYYLGGSADRNVSYWLAAALGHHRSWFFAALLVVCGWLLYSVLILPYIRQAPSREVRWFACLLLCLAVVPMKTFSVYNNLFCRGAAPLMFLLLIFMLRALKYYWENSEKKLVAIMVSLFMLGGLSALSANIRSLRNYENERELYSVVDFPQAWENFGPDESVFNRILRKDVVE